MNHRHHPGFLLPFLLFVWSFALVCTRAAAEDNSCTAECHAKLVQPKAVHAAARSCGNCHQPVTTPHPQAGQKTFKLKDELPALCTNCHDAFGEEGPVHSPVKAGHCTTCHNPHASEEPKLLTKPIKELCTTCHDEQIDHKLLHGPVSAGDCTVCHNPHESKNKPLLLKPVPTLCFDCHHDIEEVLKKKVVHPAIDDGCPTCHDPHGSDNPKLLAEAGQKVCFKCHKNIAETVTTAAVPHPALSAEQGCIECHSPHATDNPKLLTKPLQDTCLGCHKNIITAAMTVLHGPVKDGACTACHQPHGGANAKLLVRAFSTDTYVPYSDTEYALCFGCHKRDLVQYPDTSFATNFRDGERNLHFLHVNRAKGRSCKLCHAIHGSANDRLVPENVSFGKWKLPLKYVKTETGGGCSPGCHKPATYDRKEPGKKPAVAKPAK